MDNDIFFSDDFLKRLFHERNTHYYIDEVLSVLGDFNEELNEIEEHIGIVSPRDTDWVQSINVSTQGITSNDAILWSIILWVKKRYSVDFSWEEINQLEQPLYYNEETVASMYNEHVLRNPKSNLNITKQPKKILFRFFIKLIIKNTVNLLRQKLLNATPFNTRNANKPNINNVSKKNTLRQSTYNLFGSSSNNNNGGMATRNEYIKTNTNNNTPLSSAHISKRQRLKNLSSRTKQHGSHLGGS